MENCESPRIFAALIEEEHTTNRRHIQHIINETYHKTKVKENDFVFKEHEKYIYLDNNLEHPSPFKQQISSQYKDFEQTPPPPLIYYPRKIDRSIRSFKLSYERKNGDLRAFLQMNDITYNGYLHKL